MTKRKKQQNITQTTPERRKPHRGWTTGKEKSYEKGAWKSSVAQRGQPGGNKPRSATTKAVPKATVETEQGSQQEGVPTGPVGGNPTPIQTRSRNPQEWKPSKVRTPKRENRRYKVGDPPPSGAGASPPVHPRPPRKSSSKSSGLREDRTRTRDRGERESRTTIKKSLGILRI